MRQCHATVTSPTAPRPAATLPPRSADATLSLLPPSTITALSCYMLMRGASLMSCRQASAVYATFTRDSPRVRLLCLLDVFRRPRRCRPLPDFRRASACFRLPVVSPPPAAVTLAIRFTR